MEPCILFSCVASFQRASWPLAALLVTSLVGVTGKFNKPGFQNRYYQSSSYRGSRVLEHNQSGRFEQYMEVLWPSQAAVDENGRIWVVNKRSHEVLLIETASRYVPWPAFFTEYSGKAGMNGYVDGSRLKARFDGPSGIVLTTSSTSSFRLYVTDSNNHVIRVLDYKSGRVGTIAGARGDQGLKDGPGDMARFRYPSNLGMNAAGSNLFVLDNGSKIRHIKLFLKSRYVTTLVGGACRAVSRWTVYSSIVLRRVGCHPDWTASEAGEKVLDASFVADGDLYCSGHLATCAPRNHPALADRLAPQLLTKQYALGQLALRPPDNPYADLR
eukprot:TRINITY_DN15500_c0_g1_i1.p1 TRINITY_DN15500_c0_g1~~TRINITY_DN15500_c0_g1_i1.p1  ORF type:complete len:328 (-),score=36.47 TRINITY_DN15500_c0_g1_i1:41-1024(-)